MKRIVLIILALWLPLAANAQADSSLAPTIEPPVVPIPAQGVDLASFLWESRPLVVFADTSADPRFQRQLELLAARPDELDARDVVVIVDSDPGAHTAVREALRPRGFMWVLIDKDGSIMLRKPLPWHVRELVSVIDKTPLRQQELKEMRDAQREAAGE